MKTSKQFLNHWQLALALAAMFIHCATLIAPAATYYWDSDDATAGFGSTTGTWGTDAFWSTNALGDASTIFTATTTTNDIANFGTATLNYANAAVAVAAGGVSINKIVFGAGQSTGITLSGGSITLGGTSPSITVNNSGQTINSALTLHASTTIVAGQNGATVASLNGVIGGSGNLTFTTAAATVGSSGTAIGFVLGAANTYSGNTTITSANINNVMNIKATVDNSLPVTTVLTLNGGNGTSSGRQVSYDLNSNNQTLAGLVNVTGLSSRPQRILNSGGAAVTLTISNTAPASSAFGGNINTNGSGVFNVTKKGTGTQILSGVSSYTGNTRVSGGKLQLVVGGSCPNSTIIVDTVAATNSVSITDNANKWTCGNLTTTAAGVLEFSFGAVTPSTSLSPLQINGAANFTVTPKVQVAVDAGLLPGEYPLMTWSTTTGTPPTNADLTVSAVTGGTAVGLSNSTTTLFLVVSSTTTTIVKANNSANLNLGGSWVGGGTPNSLNVATWDNTVTAANTTVLGADQTWAGIAIQNPNGPVTINAGSTLNLAAAAKNIDLSAATADLTLNCNLALSAANIWDVTAGRTLTVAGAVSGAFGISKQGVGTAILSGTNIYTGGITVTAGTLKIIGTNTIPDGPAAGNVAIAAAGTLDLNGFSETINSLSGAGKVDTLAAATSVTLTTSNAANTTFSGNLRNSGAGSTLHLIKQGAGVLTLSGSNSFSGSTTVSGGTLILANTAALDATTGIALAAGTTLTPNLSAITIAAPITIGAANTSVSLTAPDVDGSGTTAFPVSFNGVISGAGDVAFTGINAANGYGTINLNATNNYQGATLITTISGYDGGPTNNAQIFVKLGVANALPPTTVLTLDGGNGVGSGRVCDLNLNGKNQTLAGLTNVPGRALRSQRINNTSATVATLTVSNSANYTFSGLLGSGGGNLNLAKAGPGTLTLTGTNSYSGTTVVAQGTLAIGVASLNTSATVAVSNGAVLQLNFSTTNTVGALILNGVTKSGGFYNSANAAPFITGTGSLLVASPGPSGPATLTNSVSGNMLSLSWPAGQGWRLEAQTNSLSVGLSNNWSQAAGSSVSSTNITIDPTKPAVFFRLAYP